MAGRAAQAVALATFFALVPGCSLVSAGMVAEALFQVSAVPPVLIDNGQTRFDAREYAIYQKSQVELLKSFFVINAAIRDPGIATLPILAPLDDPVAWLQKHLEIEFLDGSEILSIRLRGTDSQTDDLKRIVDAVARAYEKEVVYNDRQRRLLIRDTKAKTAEGLAKDITTKMSKVAALKEELGPNSVDSSEVRFKQIEVDVLTDVYRQLRRSLELEEVEFNAPARIRQFQPAVVSPD
jgi:hypothetical protein